MELDTHHKRGSSGVAKAGLTTGIIGASLGVLNGVGNLGKLLGGGGGGCNEPVVTRYELGQEAALAAKDSEIALLRSNIYNDQKSLEMYQYVDGRLRNVEAQLAAQAVANQATKDSFQIAEERRACLERELNDAIRRECEARKCSDNTIINYVNATFYPKMVSDVTTGTTTTAATVYNPLPIAACGC